MNSRVFSMENLPADHVQSAGQFVPRDFFVCLGDEVQSLAGERRRQIEVLRYGPLLRDVHPGHRGARQVFKAFVCTDYLLGEEAVFDAVHFDQDRPQASGRGGLRHRRQVVKLQKGELPIVLVAITPLGGRGRDAEQQGDGQKDGQRLRHIFLHNLHAILDLLYPGCMSNGIEAQAGRRRCPGVQLPHGPHQRGAYE